jgi:hypothetical protein
VVEEANIGDRLLRSIDAGRKHLVNAAVPLTPSASSAAARAKAAAFAAEGHELLGMATLAAHTQASVLPIRGAIPANPP